MGSPQGGRGENAGATAGAEGAAGASSALQTGIGGGGGGGQPGAEPIDYAALAAMEGITGADADAAGGTAWGADGRRAAHANEPTLVCEFRRVTDFKRMCEVETTGDLVEHEAWLFFASEVVWLRALLLDGRKCKSKDRGGNILTQQGANI